MKIFLDHPSEDELDLVIIFLQNNLAIKDAYAFAWNENTNVFLLNKRKKNKWVRQTRYLGYLDFVCQIVELGVISLILLFKLFLADLVVVIIETSWNFWLKKIWY